MLPTLTVVNDRERHLRCYRCKWSIHAQLLYMHILPTLLYRHHCHPIMVPFTTSTGQPRGGCLFSEMLIDATLLNFSVIGWIQMACSSIYHYVFSVAYGSLSTCVVFSVLFGDEENKN